MLSYQITGRGRPLLLIHGWGVTYAVWNQLTPLLARHFQLILVDLLGLEAISTTAAKQSYYVAYAEALEELRESLGITRWSLLSYSIGTLVGEAYLQRYPLRVERAAFVSPIYARWFWQIILGAFRWLDRRDARPASWVLSGWRLNLVMRLCGFNLERHPAAADWAREAALQPVQLLKRLLLDMPEHGRGPYLSAASPHIPTLFLWGQRDVMSGLPPNPGPNDVFLPFNHAAPVSAPFMIASTVLPFLTAQEASHPREPVASRALSGRRSVGLGRRVRVTRGKV